LKDGLIACRLYGAGDAAHGAPELEILHGVGKRRNGHCRDYHDDGNSYEKLYQGETANWPVPSLRSSHITKTTNNLAHFHGYVAKSLFYLINAKAEKLIL
jgi:hypothetical protein